MSDKDKRFIHEVPRAAEPAPPSRQARMTRGAGADPIPAEAVKSRRPSVKRTAFLAAYARTGNISTASRLANVARSRHYEWMKEPEYAAAFAEAREEAIETLEEQVWKSATVGFEEPVIYKGQLCFEPLRDRNGNIVRDETGLPKLSKIPLTIRKRNDVAAFFLLKALRPEKYRENVKIDHAAPLNLVERLKEGRERVAKMREEQRPA